MALSDFKWRPFQGAIILWAVRGYCRYRDLEQMMGELFTCFYNRTIYLWMYKYPFAIDNRRKR